MKNLSVLTGIAALAASAALAQTSIEDSDGDGAYSLEELMVVYPELSEEVYAVLDTNGDGMIDGDEVAIAEEAGVLSN